MRRAFGSWEPSFTIDLSRYQRGFTKGFDPERVKSLRGSFHTLYSNFAIRLVFRRQSTDFTERKALPSNWVIRA